MAQGASCNCEVVTLIPHCNGTHTECAAHLTREPLDAYRVAPAGLIPALLLSVTPAAAGSTREGTVPAPNAQDLLVTRRALEDAWPAQCAVRGARAGGAHAAQSRGQAAA